jgi:hypothetical protein
MTEPEVWRWYCRTDGSTGEHLTREERDTAALHHLKTDCVLAGVEYEGGTINQAYEVEHLLHVWRTPAYVGQYTAPLPPS